MGQRKRQRAIVACNEKPEIYFKENEIHSKRGYWYGEFQISTSLRVSRSLSMKVF